MPSGAIGGVAIWRGSNTGPSIHLSTWAANPRARLAVLSNLFPHEIDAAITNWPQPHGDLSQLTRFVRNTSHAPFSLYNKYKFVLDVDGNVQSTAGPLLAPLRSVILVASRFRTAYSLSLQRLPHVIMLRPDLADTVDVIHCLRRRDEQALMRVRRGSCRAAAMLSYESVLGYWADLLEHYAARQRFQPVRAPNAVLADRLLIIGRKVAGGSANKRRRLLTASADVAVAAPAANSLVLDLIYEAVGRSTNDFAQFVDTSRWASMTAAAAVPVLGVGALLAMGSRWRQEDRQART